MCSGGWVLRLVVGVVHNLSFALWNESFGSRLNEPILAILTGGQPHEIWITWVVQQKNINNNNEETTEIEQTLYGCSIGGDVMSKDD